MSESKPTKNASLSGELTPGMRQYAEAKRQLRAVPGARMVLIRPGERLSGATVFYCRAVTPELKKWNELKRGDVALAGMRSKEPLPQFPEGFSVRRFPDAKLLLISSIP